MIGLALSYLTRPHAVGPAGIRARLGADIDVDLPWEAVASRRAVRATSLEKAPKVRDEEHGRTLSLRMANETNILIVLEKPVRTRLSANGSSRSTRCGCGPTTLDGFLTAVRTHIP